MHRVATLTQSTLKFQHLNMAEYMMETVEDYQREETSKQVYQFYNYNKLKYRKLCKEFDEDEVEVDDNTTQERYTKEREYGEIDEKHGEITSKHDENKVSSLKLFRSMRSEYFNHMIYIVQSQC